MSGKRIMVISLLSAGLALGGSVTSLTPQEVRADDNVSQQCKAIMDLTVTHGGCVALLGNANNGTPFASAVCKDIAEQMGTNHGQCLQVLKFK